MKGICLRLEHLGSVEISSQCNKNMCIFWILSIKFTCYFYRSYEVFLTFLQAFAFILGGEGVKIRHLRIPDVVLNGTEQPVILDCDYVLDMPATTSGLVVKWFFNNHPAPVYQWIFNKKPQDLGVLKGKVNLNYKATNEESTMYRFVYAFISGSKQNWKLNFLVGPCSRFNYFTNVVFPQTALADSDRHKSIVSPHRHSANKWESAEDAGVAKVWSWDHKCLWVQFEGRRRDVSAVSTKSNTVFVLGNLI